jgi:Meiotically up-regulated gene 113
MAETCRWPGVTDVELPQGKSQQVYFIKIGRAIKIGFTTELKQRIASFRGASSEQITILAVFPGSKKAERYLHNLFSDLKITIEFF